MGALTVKSAQRITSNKYRTAISDKVRVCFYGRVSTQHEAQMNALENQIQWYDSILSDHPNWEKINVYVDDADIIGLNQKTFDLRGFTD